MMSFHEFANYILEKCPSVRSAEIYGFGSFLRDGIGVDYDLLLVSGDQALISLVKLELSTAAENVSVDLLVMDRNEVAESDFVQRFGCVPICEISSMRAYEHIS